MSTPDSPPPPAIPPVTASPSAVTADPPAVVHSAVTFQADQELQLDSGAVLKGVTVAYRCYGELNADKSNAILVCHALTGDQYVAEEHPLTGRAGWWEIMVGPGRPLDTNRYHIICSNIIGGCMGSTGPKEINPDTGEPWGVDFPVVTINDMVRAQKMLIDHLDIDKLFAVIGGSMGGMQVLAWAANYPDKLYAAVPIATAGHHTAQNIAFHEIGRQAILADPDWCGGRYLEAGKSPRRGLAVARMTAHVTYLSEPALQRKFGRRLQDRKTLTYGFDADFQVESYLRYQGSAFVSRFDANSYLYITRAMDYFDLAADQKDGKLAEVFRDTPVRFCMVSFSSDWLFPTRESKRLVHALNAVAADVSFVEIESDGGHDSFLLNVPEFHATLHGFLNGCAEQCGLPIGDLAPVSKRVQDPAKDRIT